ncbi:MAG TPA: GatB/YqeY domain-containing protein [Candidatus Berkiella sp.]|nr:GatB/YqeY domain-containing protein [Candidatus Berkiella sp.]
MSQTIKEKVLEETKAAMKAQDKERLMVLRLISSEFKRIEVDERIVLDNTRELAILDKMQKQRRDSIEQYKAANRNELAEKEQFEIDVIQSFKPEALSEAAVKELVAAAIKESSAASIQDMGKVMAILRPQLQGRADMGQVSAIIKALLSGQS